MDSTPPPLAAFNRLLYAMRYRYEEAAMDALNAARDAGDQHDTEEAYEGVGCWGGNA